MKVFRCSGCRQRFPVDEVFTTVGLSRVCSVACATTVRERQRPSSPPAARKRGPKGERANDVPMEVRAAVILRDRARCRFCGEPSLSLHHIIYRSQGGQHVERNLICLCTEHHDLMHSSKPTWQPILQEVVRILHDERRSVTIPEVQRRWPSSS